MAPVDTMILEVVITQVLEGEEAEFEEAHRKGSDILADSHPNALANARRGPGGSAGAA